MLSFVGTQVANDKLETVEKELHHGRIELCNLKARCEQILRKKGNMQVSLICFACFTHSFLAGYRDCQFQEPMVSPTSQDCILSFTGVHYSKKEKKKCYGRLSLSWLVPY